MFLHQAARVTRVILTSSAFLALGSCSDDEPLTPNAPAACTGNVTVTVSAGTTPTFSWTPACSIVSLYVEEGANDHWAIFANGDPGFGPSVTYGMKPEGTNQTVPTTPLKAGSTYSVTLFRGPLASPQVSALQIFVP